MVIISIAGAVTTGVTIIGFSFTANTSPECPVPVLPIQSLVQKHHWPLCEHWLSPILTLNGRVDPCESQSCVNCATGPKLAVGEVGTALFDSTHNG